MSLTVVFFIWIFKVLTVECIELSQYAVILNETLELVCPLNLKDEIPVSWFTREMYNSIGYCKNDKYDALQPYIFDRFRVKIGEHEKCTLIINNIRKSDEKNYTCIGSTNGVLQNYTFIVKVNETPNNGAKSVNKTTRICERRTDVEFICQVEKNFTRINIEKRLQNVSFIMDMDSKKSVKKFVCSWTPIRHSSTTLSKFQVYITDDNIDDTDKGVRIKINCVGHILKDTTHNGPLSKCHKQMLTGFIQNHTLTLRLREVCVAEDRCDLTIYDVFRCKSEWDKTEGLNGLPLDFLFIKAMIAVIGVTILGLTTYLCVSKVKKTGRNNNGCNKESQEEYGRNRNTGSSPNNCLGLRQTEASGEKPVSYVVKHEKQITKQTNDDDKARFYNYQIDTHKKARKPNPINSVLNYSEVVFDSKTLKAKFYIKGKEEKTPYAEIDLTLNANPLPESDQSSERDNDESCY